MTDEPGMSLPEAMAELRRPYVLAEATENGVLISLWPFGLTHGGTASVITLDPTAAQGLHDRLTAALASLDR